MLRSLKKIRNLQVFFLVNRSKAFVIKPQLEAIEKVIKKQFVRKVSVIQPLFFNFKFTSKGVGSRMGKGKGSIKVIGCFPKVGTGFYFFSGVKKQEIFKNLYTFSSKVSFQFKLKSRLKCAKSE